MFYLHVGDLGKDFEHCLELQKKLDDLINELKEKEREVEKFEGDIKQRHIKIAKKQHKVDRLNR